MTAAALLDPISGRPLVQVSRHVLSDGASRWPVIDGIAYLRSGPADQSGPAGLRGAALAAIDADDERGALALLLTDQDSHAPLPAPSLETTLALVDAVRAKQETLRGAMRALNFGPVADYFAHRPRPLHFCPVWPCLPMLAGRGGLLSSLPVASAIFYANCLRTACLRSVWIWFSPSCG